MTRPADVEAAREADARDEARARQPIGYALQDTLGAAVDQAQGPARHKLEVALVGLGAHLARQRADITEAEALAYLTDLGLLAPGLEPYTVVVDGAVAGTIACRNRFHAVNKARKDFGLHVAEYRYVAGRREIHGSRPAPKPLPAEDEVFRGVAGPEPNWYPGTLGTHHAGEPLAAQEPARATRHELGLERRPMSAWPVRAACSCGWRGSWYKDEAGTQIARRAHATACGLEG